MVNCLRVIAPWAGPELVIFMEQGANDRKISQRLIPSCNRINSLRGIAVWIVHVHCSRRYSSFHVARVCRTVRWPNSKRQEIRWLRCSMIDLGPLGLPSVHPQCRVPTGLGQGITSRGPLRVSFCLYYYHKSVKAYR